MESRSPEGERPVTENRKDPSSTLSNAMHVKLRVNPSRPRDKAKYILVTDSGQVPRATKQNQSYPASQSAPPQSQDHEMHSVALLLGLVANTHAAAIPGMTLAKDYGLVTQAKDYGLQTLASTLEQAMPVVADDEVNSVSSAGHAESDFMIEPVTDEYIQDTALDPHM